MSFSQVFFAFTIGGFYLGQSTINIGRLMEAAVTAIPVFETIDRVCKEAFGAIHTMFAIMINLMSPSTETTHRLLFR